jgi:FK506-binding nuclear protein
MNPEDLVDLPSDEDDEDAEWVTHYLFLSYNLCWYLFLRSRFEEVPSDHEAGTAKSAKRPRESDTVEHETNDKASKKKAKKLKAENGAAVPAPAAAEGEAQKKGEKKDKKAKKSGESKEGDSKKEGGKEGDAKQKQGDKSLRELPSGLQVQDAKVGDGPQAKSGMRVAMRYVGKLPNGNVFDSNTKGKPVRHLR